MLTYLIFNVLIITNPKLKSFLLSRTHVKKANLKNGVTAQQAVWQNGGFSAKFNGSSSIKHLCFVPATSPSRRNVNNMFKDFKKSNIQA